MALQLHITGPDRTVASLRRALRETREDLREATRRARDFRRAWRRIDRRISEQVRKSFARGWPEAPLGSGTRDHRARRRGYYARSPRFLRRTGRWTGRLYRGLLGQSPLGRRVFTASSYDRSFTATGAEEIRAESFIYGRGPAGWDTRGQRARRAWPGNRWRERVAFGVLREYVTKEIVGPLRGRTA